MPLHTLERYGSGCCDGIRLSTGRVFFTRFFYSFFLFFRARTRGQAAKPLSMRVFGYFHADSIPSFSGLSPSFSGFVRLFPGAIHNPSCFLFDGLFNFRRNISLSEIHGV